MPLRTTVIGCYPKPDYLEIPTWFKPNFDLSPAHYSEYCRKMPSDELEKLVKKATKDVIKEQIEMGIDVISDGEMRRDNYVYYFCRHVNGFDFKNPVVKPIRNGACEIHMPRIIGKIGQCSEDDWVAKEWRLSQDMSRVPVKYTVPGPMTIIDSTHNEYYRNEELSEDLIKVINKQILGLAKAVAIEDAHRHNDLTLLKHFKKSQVVLGVVAVARSRVETAEEIRSRLSEALKYIPAERLLVAPDCGLGFLPHGILKQKLQNMVKAAKSLP
uniref:5-methyltetrahydropteroyltriglutamate-- homocysteine methyltransferase 3, chloroplastic-like n=1 Tax=Saccoglossus kowalevskii TaxID=10224 RepID=A0ABM0MDR3_SACKO|nr:PREDICTED: 5-methyltetrahydropteroyltriglutamate--homocysteine methyltransferase 3, chloroplastic-like [Saccoglossus kowalevskii]